MRIKHRVRFRKDYLDFARAFVLGTVLSALMFGAMLTLLAYLSGFDDDAFLPLVFALASLNSLFFCWLIDIEGHYDTVPVVEHKVRR